MKVTLTRTSLKDTKQDVSYRVPLGLKKGVAACAEMAVSEHNFGIFQQFEEESHFGAELKKTAPKRAFCQNMKNTCQICSA